MAVPVPAAAFREIQPPYAAAVWSVGKIHTTKLHTSGSMQVELVRPFLFCVLCLRLLSNCCLEAAATAEESSVYGGSRQHIRESHQPSSSKGWFGGQQSTKEHRQYDTTQHSLGHIDAHEPIATEALTTQSESRLDLSAGARQRFGSPIRAAEQQYEVR